ncbi:hypothetical protein [Pseudoalteromonas tetraodonis]|uniref:hypothetical protein n=1 Tax=Pseudoalteromonas tetraodonis TaxID=43659 RepID=UPI003003277B
MAFDITGIAIIAGIVGAAVYAAVELIRHRDLEVINSAVVCLTIIAMVAGGNLISVAMDGDPENLPTTWREYITVAGVVGIGLSMQQMINVIKKLFSQKAGAAKPALDSEANKHKQADA